MMKFVQQVPSLNTNRRGEVFLPELFEPETGGRLKAPAKADILHRGVFRLKKTWDHDASETFSLGAGDLINTDVELAHKGIVSNSATADLQAYLLIKGIRITVVSATWYDPATLAGVVDGREGAYITFKDLKAGNKERRKSLRDAFTAASTVATQNTNTTIDEILVQLPTNGGQAFPSSPLVDLSSNTNCQITLPAINGGGFSADVETWIDVWGMIVAPSSGAVSQWKKGLTCR